MAKAAIPTCILHFSLPCKYMKYFIYFHIIFKNLSPFPFVVVSKVHVSLCLLWCALPYHFVNLAAIALGENVLLLFFDIFSCSCSLNSKLLKSQ